MKIWDDFITKWNGWIADLQKFSAERWGTIWVIGGLVAGGGFLAAVFGWPFALIVPAWLVLVAYVMKKKYKG
ncbi:MAG TPA: hypothetical protein VMX17_01495 [Candidatus Glassbacteria bacterium]|nr:hypothetical protein [Candidatus Glassbacteria bacterium]